MSDSRASRPESIDLPSLHEASARTANLNTCTQTHPSHMGAAFDHRHPHLAVSILKPTIPEHSLQSLYISPAITKKKNHRQTQFSVNKSRYISVLFLPVAQWGRMCCRAKPLSAYPIRYTNPASLLPVSPPNAEWPPRNRSNHNAFVLEHGSTNAMQHAITSREHDIHQVRSRRNRQRDKKKTCHPDCRERKKKLGFGAPSSSTYLTRPNKNKNPSCL